MHTILQFGRLFKTPCAKSDILKDSKYVILKFDFLLKRIITASLLLPLLHMCMMWFLTLLLLQFGICTQTWHPILMCRIARQARISPLLMATSTLALVSVNPGFSKKDWSLVSSCDCPLRSTLPPLVTSAVLTIFKQSPVLEFMTHQK